VNTQDLRTPHSDANDPSRRPSLLVELRVPDRHMLATFRGPFMRWLTDRSGPFARAIGATDRISVNELPPGADPHGMSTLRITVSWSIAGKFARSMATSRPATRVPSAASRLETIDPFVFVSFPDEHPDVINDENQAEAPLPGQLPASSHANAVPPALWAPEQPRLRYKKPVSVNLRPTVVAALQAVQSFVRACARGLGIGGLTVRVPVVARPRAWAFSLVGTTALTTGFVGSIYLTTMNRPRLDRQAAPASAAVSALPTRPVPPPAVIAASDVSGGATLPPAGRRSEEPETADRSTSGRLPEMSVATSGSAGIADTGVATVSPRRNSVARAPLPRRPSVAVVRAVPASPASSGPSSVMASDAASRRVKGTLLVKSDPLGAEVSINGIVHGRTPLMIRDLGAGSRVLRLDLPGYERWSWAVTVVANRRTPVTVKLRPESRPVGLDD
jgi:hypothetical protein